MGYSEKELLQLHAYDIRPEFSEEKFGSLVAILTTSDKASLRFKKHSIEQKVVKIFSVEVFLQCYP